jgi:hypothetical protein
MRPFSSSLLAAPAVALMATILACSVVLVDSAQATTSRLRSLGGQADYLEDDANVRRWYGSLIDYPGLAILELGDWRHDAGGSLASRVSRQGGGLHVPFDRAGKWGLGAIYFGEEMPAPDRGGWIQLLAARRFGKLAVGGSFLGSSASDADSTHDPGLLDGTSNFVHELGLGLRWDLAYGVYLDLAAHRRHVSVDYFHREHGIAIKGAHGWDSFGVRGRLFQGLTDELAAVYRLEWVRDLRLLVDDDLADLARQDADIFAAGAGLNYLPDADNLLVFSVDYRRSEDIRRPRNPFFATFDRSERDWWRLDVRCGVESRLLPWLTLRAAASYRRTLDELTLTRRWTEDFLEWQYEYRVTVDTPVVVGLGLHFGAFDADLVVNDTAPFGLGYLLTGASDQQRAGLSSITLTYRF